MREGARERGKEGEEKWERGREEEVEREEGVLLSECTLHAGYVVNIISDLSQDGHVSRVTNSALKADVGLKGRRVGWRVGSEGGMGEGGRE